MPQTYLLQSVDCSVEFVAFRQNNPEEYTIELRVDSGFQSIDSSVTKCLQQAISAELNSHFGYNSATRVQQQTEQQVSASLRDVSGAVETVSFGEFATVVAEGIDEVSTDEQLAERVDVAEAYDGMDEVLR